MVKVFVAIINLYYIVVSKAARGQKQGQSMRNVLKWVVITLIAASTFLNYVDRQTLALLASAIQGDLLIDDAGYAYLVSAFLLAYSGGTIVSGWFVDRFGARVALPIFVAWWSLANALSGMMHNVDHMALTRFALGLAEVGNFIAAPILVRQFFPVGQRAFAIGLYTAAAMFGATVSPPFITWIGATSGWRSAFIIMGVVGLIWSAVWVAIVLNKKNVALAVADADDAAIEAKEDAAAQDISTWWKALTNRAVWGVTLGAMLTYPIWYYYLFWFPKYLMDERGLSTLEMGKKTWIVYLAAGISSMIGGYLSGMLIRRGIAPKSARLWTMLGACCLAPIGAFIALEPSITVALALASCVAFFQMIWQAGATTLPTDLFPSRQLAKAYTIQGAVTAMAGMGTTWLIGHMVSMVSYRPMFIVTSCLYPVAIFVVWYLTRDAKPKGVPA